MISTLALDSIATSIEQTAERMKQRSTPYSADRHELPDVIEQMEKLLLIQAAMLKINEVAGANISTMTAEEIGDYVFDNAEIMDYLQILMGASQREDHEEEKREDEPEPS